MTAAHRSVPTLSFGTYQLRNGAEVENAIAAALSCGHRVFDTAAVYRNEESVGKALMGSNIPREALHITTKLQPSDQLGFDAAIAAIRGSLKRLGTSYVDCYLMHWPGTSKVAPDDEKNVYLRCETWRGMIEAQRLGLAREIGVCNFLVRHFESLEKAGLKQPQVHQLELHPLCRQREVVQWCRSKGIAIEAYSPLAQFDSRITQRPNVRAALMEAFQTTTISTEQIALGFLAWSFSQRYTPIARSSNTAHITSNAEAWKQWLHDTSEAAPLRRAARALESLEHADVDDTHVCWFASSVK